MSSVSQRVLERLDAELSETDAAGRPILSGKVAVTAVLGNEDGAHKITADLYQALADVGFSIPSQGGTYWNGEAHHGLPRRRAHARRSGECHRHARAQRHASGSAAVAASVPRALSSFSASLPRGRAECENRVEASA